jgi:hypothetical protein
MNNDPELNGKYMGVISSDFVKVADFLKDAAYQIKSRGYSDFPIFPICRQNTEIGQTLIPKGHLDSTWNYNVSYIDEFIQRELIKKESVEEFKNVFKDPEEFCCLFVIDYDFTNFVFIPYPEDL